MCYVLTGGGAKATKTIVKEYKGEAMSNVMKSYIDEPGSTQTVELSL